MYPQILYILSYDTIELYEYVIKSEHQQIFLK